MELSKNPFYILGATTRNNRMKIMELAEEKSLILDPDECVRVRTDLTNPRRRLVAEMSWFPGFSPEGVESIIEYLTALKQQLNPVPVDLNQFEPLAKLNFLTEQIRYKKYKDIFKHENIFKIGNAIFEIDRVFEAISPEQVQATINEDRVVSGFPLVQNTNQIEEELTTIRTNIKSIIDDRLNQLPQKDYIKLVNMIAKKCIDIEGYCRGTVIDDVLDSYEIKTKSLVDEKMQIILALAEKISIDANAIILDNVIDELIGLVIEWDKIVQPLQLNARAKGTKHEDSEKVAYIVRNLAIELHNEHEKTAQSIKLTNMLKNVFAELDEFAERTETDIKALDDIWKNQQHEQAEHDASLENEATLLGTNNSNRVNDNSFNYSVIHKVNKFVLIISLFIFIILISVVIEIGHATDSTFSYKYYQLKKYNTLDNNGNTALINAIINDDVNEAKLLIGKGVDINKQNSNIESPLIIAVARNNFEIVQALVGNGANVNWINNLSSSRYNYTVLFESVKNSNYDICNLLIDNGAELNKRNNDDNTVLMIAVNNNDFDLVKLLIEKGAEISIKNNDGYTALDYARQKKNVEITNLLLEKVIQPIDKWVWFGSESRITVYVKGGQGSPGEFNIIADLPVEGSINDTFIGQFDEKGILFHNGTTSAKTIFASPIESKKYALQLELKDDGKAIYCKITYYSKTGQWTWGKDGGILLQKS